MVMILKRSMAAGFAGVDNPLFVKENSRMLFGDAKQTVQQLVAQFKES
jgi:NAD(P) transhydrogenase subunit beta